MSPTKELLDSIKITPLMDTLRLQKIDDEEYFSEKYSNYISNSRLSLINPAQDNDPQAFFEGLSKHNKYSDALIFGSAVHELTLQPDLFEMVTTVDRPTAKAGFMADELYPIFSDETKDEDDQYEALYKASDKIGYYKGKFDSDKIFALLDKCKDYWKDRKEYESKGLESTPIYLDPKSRERVSNCVRALDKNKRIQKLLHPEGIMETPISENEQAILLDVQVEMPGVKPFILKLKAKLDNYTIDKETNTIVVNDVKTIGKILSYFEENFEKFHYHRELAIYCWLLSLCAKKYYGIDECTIKSNCLVVSTIPDFYTKVYEVTKKDFAKGFSEFQYLLKLVAYYAATEYKDFAVWT